MKLLVVEDHSIFREAILRYCSSHTNHDIVAATGSGFEAIRQCNIHKPELIILDLGLEDMDGFAVLQHWQRERPNLKKIIISAHREPYTLYRLKHFGINAYLHKGAGTLEALGEALHEIDHGRTYFTEEWMQEIGPTSTHAGILVNMLSDREHQILAHISRGHDDTEIASKLDIAMRTAKTHRSNLLKKLNLPSTPKLMSFAASLGFSLFQPQTKNNTVNNTPAHKD